MSDMGYDPTRQLPLDPTSPLHPVPPSPPKSRFWPRVGWGCGCGCLAPLLLLFLVVSWYVKASATPLTSELLWHPGLANMMSVHLDPDDSAMAEILQRVSERIDAERPEALPEELRKVMGMLGHADTRAILRALLPIEVGVAHIEGVHKGDHPDLQFASFSHHVKLIALAVEKGLEARRDASRPDLVLEGQTFRPLVGAGQASIYAGMVGHTLISSVDEDELKGLARRVRGQTPELGELGIYRQRIVGKPEVYGVLINRDSWLSTAPDFEIGRDLNAEALRDALGLAWSIDLQTASVARVSLSVRMPDEARAREYAGFLAQHRIAILDDLQRKHGYDFNGDVHADAEWVEIALSVVGFGKDLEDRILNGMR